MNQRYPQSRHTPHGGSEKTDTEKGTRARKRKRAQGGLGQWLTVATAGHVCPLPPLSPAAWFLPPVSSPPPLVPRIPHPKFVPSPAAQGACACAARGGGGGGGAFFTHTCVSPVCPGDLMPPGRVCAPGVCAFRGQSRLSLRSQVSSVGDTMRQFFQLFTCARVCVCVLTTGRVPKSITPYCTGWCAA